MSLDARQAALDAWESGLSVLPPKEDGSKAPDGQWLYFQQHRASLAQINAWYGINEIPLRSGCGLVCGAVSGNLECFEFDSGGRLYEHYKATARALGHGDLIDRLDQGYLEQSPSGGYHWLYRCDVISGNTKLAVATDKQSLIETRGEGGYIIVAPSNGKVHKEGAYKLLNGGFASIPKITPEERLTLWDIARLFDETVADRTDPWVMKAELIGNTSPWDEYNNRTNWRDLLIEHGWTHVFTRDHVQYWRRPGKDHSHSATVNHGGTDRLKCFSSSAEFDTTGTYSRFGAYAVWHHGGDWKAAIKAVKKELAQEKAKPKPPPEGTPLVVRLDKIDPKEVNWLWPGRIPKGFITIFYGTTGVGKSFVTLDIAARLTRGDAWPDLQGECCNSGNVLIISEDPFEYVLAPRLIELGAVMSKVFAMTWETMQTWAINDVKTLGRAFKESGDPILIVIDPPTNFLGEIDEHKNSEVRAALMQLVIWLDKQKEPVACILITHVNKNVGKGIEAIYRLLGSVAWGSTARIAHAFTPDPADRRQCLFVCSKSNICSLPKGLSFRLTKTEKSKMARVEWGGEVDVSANEAMEGESKQSRGERAAEWLEEKFSIQREYLANDIKALAREDGISWNALHEPPASILAIVKEKKGKIGLNGKTATIWRWVGPLPEKIFSPETSGQFGTVGTVDIKPIQDNNMQLSQSHVCSGTVEMVDGTVKLTVPTVPLTVPESRLTIPNCPGGRDSCKLSSSTELSVTVPTVPKLEYEEEKTRATRFLVGMLQHGERSRSYVEEWAEKKQIGLRAIEEATVLLGVERTLRDGNEFWWLRGPRKS